MTEERFTFVDNFSSDEPGMDILDTYTDKRYNKYHIGGICNVLNKLAKENEQLKSTIAQLIEQNRKNNDLLLSDIRILEKALWCSGCENDYGRLKELRKEFIR